MEGVLRVLRTALETAGPLSASRYPGAPIPHTDSAPGEPVSRFEYLSVLVSIVIALGLSEVSLAWARLLQNRTHVRFSWLHGFWSAFTVFLMVQFWWGFWNFRTVEAWSLLGLLGVVAETMTLVLCALLLTPPRALAGAVDLGALFHDGARTFFLVGAVLLVQLSLVDSLILGTPLLHVENGVRLLGVGVALAAARSASPRFHGVLAAVSAALLGAFLLFSIEL